ncbi:MAG: hypothetical protein ACFE8L_05510 [Candidatus Hodarchaeota archaeon]
MESKEKEAPKAWKAFLIIIIIICVLVGIVLATAVHFKLLTDRQPGYPFDKFLLKFFWLDLLIGIGVGIAILFALLFLILFFTQERSNSTQ